MTTAGNRPKGITKGHLINGHIGEDYWEVDFSSFQGPKQARDEAYTYLENLKYNKDKGLGLLFAGKVGTGKTSLLAIVLKYLAKANWSVYMITYSELVEMIKRSWDDKELVVHIDHLKRVDFLGLDDLGKEHQGPTGFSAVTFDNLLRARSQHRLPTLFTTNLTRNQLRERYGEATISLIEGKTRIIPVSGVDYRQEVLRHEI